MSETSIKLTSVFCTGPLILYYVFTKKRSVVAIINQPGTTSGKGQSQLLIIDLFIFYCPNLRSVTWGEVGCGTFCLVVLGVDALLGLHLQFPIRWGRLNTFSQLQHIINILSQWVGHTCKQRCSNFMLCSFRKALFSMFSNNSWSLTDSCERKKSSLVYRFPKICWISASTMSTKLQLPAEQVRKPDENKDVEISWRKDPVILFWSNPKYFDERYFK